MKEILPAGMPFSGVPEQPALPKGRKANASGLQAGTPKVPHSLHPDTASRKKQLPEAAARVLFGLCAIVSSLAVLAICAFLFVNAWPAVSEIGLFSFLGGLYWNPDHDLYGILPMIVSTIYVSVLAMVFGVPLGLGTAAYLVFFAPKKSAGLLKSAVDFMAGVPSIVYGLFGLMVLVPLIQFLFGTSGKGILSAGLLLGLMIIPTIVSLSTAALQAVDPAMYENALALGADHERSVFTVVFKAAKSGILSSIIMAFGRAAGETMAVVMVAGNAAILPASVTSNARTLTANIVLEMGYAQGLHRSALIASAAVLLVLILLISLSFQAFRQHRS